MSAPDISAEAVERLAALSEEWDRWEMNAPVPEKWDHALHAATLRALRAALDAAERERDEARQERDAEAAGLTWFRLEAKAADATGYARGVQDAVGALKIIPVTVGGPESHPDRVVAQFGLEVAEAMRSEATRSILALLPATDATKETRDGND